ncbi:MAG TPA: hypothetical protein PLY93_02770 [Turneriella sp.]|nr:hypothetical protein [Turneriella sp.]
MRLLKKEHPTECIDPYLQFVVNTYVYRSRETYKNYFEQENTQPLADYFFEKIYTLDGKSERDALAEKTYNRFKGMLTEKSRGRIENLLLLNEITDRLDREMADFLRHHSKYLLSDIRTPHIDLDKLPLIYRKCNRMEDRVEQLRLVVQNLESFFELSKHPLAGVIMRPVSLAARTVGFTSLYKIFEAGYDATKPISKEVFFEFTQYVRKRETQFLEKIYKKRIHLP